jgi:hypothetical protein
MLRGTRGRRESSPPLPCHGDAALVPTLAADVSRDTCDKRSSAP